MLTWTRKCPSPDTKSTGTLIVNFSDSRTVRNKFSLSHQFTVLLLQHLKWTMTDHCNTATFLKACGGSSWSRKFLHCPYPFPGPYLKGGIYKIKLLWLFFQSLTTNYTIGARPCGLSSGILPLWKHSEWSTFGAFFSFLLAEISFNNQVIQPRYNLCEWERPFVSHN